MVTRALAVEDGSLSTPALITSRKVDYSDVDLSFEAKPSGDVYKKKDAAAVKQAVKNILLTSPGEKPFQPRFGAGLGSLLFELMDDDAEEDIDRAIRTAIENFEPRARVVSTEINAANDLNTISVTVTFQIVNTNEVVTLKTSLARIR